METQQTTKSKFGLGFFFLSLGVLISLITSVVSFLNLVFGTLEKQFPDALNSTYTYGYSTYDYESIRSALAVLIIFFPIFLLISHFWKKNIKKGIGHVDEVVRKWMIYIILFLSAVVVAVDLVTLVRYFISGEITTRFILKVLAVLVVAVIVGVYYMLELQGKKKILGLNIGVWSAVKASILVVALVFWSFSVIGSPAQQRLWRLDDRRVQDLQSIQWQVISYWQQKEKLPVTLAELINPLSGFSMPVDPEFEQGKVYEYNVKTLPADPKDPKKVSPITFELCATFLSPIPKGWQENKGGVGFGGSIMPMRDVAVSSYPYPGPGGVNESWDHQAGRTCFERTIDKDMYPPYPKPMSEPAMKQ